MDTEFVRNRITELRLKKGVSEYRMSYDLGRNKNYIQHISNGKGLPSLSELLYICEYFGVTPAQFFDDGASNPILVQKILDGVRDMSDKDLLTILDVIDRFNHR